MTKIIVGEEDNNVTHLTDPVKHAGISKIIIWRESNHAAAQMPVNHFIMKNIFKMEGFFLQLCKQFLTIVFYISFIIKRLQPACKYFINWTMILAYIVKTNQI